MAESSSDDGRPEQMRVPDRADNSDREHYSDQTNQTGSAPPEKENPYGLKRQKTTEIIHGMLFGNKPLPYERRTTISTRQNPKPFELPKTAEWILPIPVTSVPALLNGAFSSTMENKLSIYADGPDINGEARLHILHAWSKRKLVELQLNLALILDEHDNASYREPRITAITWEEAMDWWMDTEAATFAVAHLGSKVSDYSRDEEISRINIELPPLGSWTWQVDRALLAAEDTESREEMAKYLALEACRFAMDIQLVDRIQEPRAWAKLPEYTYPQAYVPDKPEYTGLPGAREMENLRTGDEVKYS